MTSKIVVNNIESDSGISSVTFTSDIELGTKNLKGHNLESTGIVTAVSFTGSGANLTNLPAGNLTGTIADARFPSTLPAVDGSNLTGVGHSFGNSSVNTSGIITATAFIPTTGQLSHRNMIINGGMMISQRASSLDITGGSNTYPVLDRFMTVANSSMSYNVTISQEADNPDGLGKSFKSLTTSAKTPSGSENYIIRQRLEEQDIRRVAFGTSACKKSTLTFFVKSNKTGTYSVMLYLAGFSINLLTTYTISAQNTWEKKIISIPAYTTSYSHPGDTAAGLTFDWHLSSGPDDIVSPHSWQSSATNARAATGQVNILDAVNNYWQITNVQYEVGEVSTPFEHRTVADELARCQRYYQVIANDNQQIISNIFVFQNNRITGCRPLVCEMRTTPTVVDNTSGGTRFRINASSDQNTGNNITVNTTVSSPSALSIGIDSLASNMSNGSGGVVRKQGSSAQLGVSAEL